MCRLTCFSIFCLMSVALSGCASAPAGTTWIDTNGNFIDDTLVVDADQDGQADVPVTPVEDALDPVVVESINELDATGPALLNAAGALVMPIVPWLGTVLGAGGILWMKNKYGKILLNTIMSVQAVRGALKQNGNALSVVDKLLDQSQTKETAAIIRKIKNANDVSSIRKLPTIVEVPAVATPTPATPA